jgi:hypothetical protein
MITMSSIAIPRCWAARIPPRAMSSLSKYRASTSGVAVSTFSAAASPASELNSPV